MKRTHTELIFLTIALAGIVGVSPFIVLRIIDGQWIVAMIDAAMAAFAGALVIYVWLTRKVRIPSIALTLFYLSGLVAVVHVRGPDMVYWAYPGLVAAFFLIKPVEAAVISLLVLTAMAPVLVQQLSAIEMVSIIVTLLLNILFSYIFTRGIHGRHTELTRQATRDALTGAGNRGLFDENFQHLYTQYRRDKTPCSLIMIDIDHFKDINDTYGHARGDQVLKKLIHLLDERLRKSDVLYRLGGEEFAILLPETHIDAAFRVAENLRKRIARSALLAEQATTISLGVAELMPEDDTQTWFQRADHALYEAKHQGRNQTCIGK